MSRELKRRMVDGGLWAACGRVFAIIGAFVLNLLLARGLAPEDYAAYFVVMSTMIILATVGTLGMDRVAVRFVAARKALGALGDVRTVIVRCLWVVFVSTALLCTAFYLLAPWFFTEVVKAPPAVAFGGLLVLWLLFSTLQRQLAETFRGLNDIRGATLFGGFRNNGILTSLITCGAMLVLWLSGRMTLASVILATVCTSLLVAALAAWKLSRHPALATTLPRQAPSEEWSTAGMLREGWPLWLASLIAVLRAQVSGWFAAGFDSADQVALFAVASRFSLLVMAPLTIVNMLLPPVVAELHARGETRRMGRVVQAVGGLAALPCLAILAVILVAGRQSLGLLFGPHYEAAYVMLVVLCVGQIANIATGSWQVVLAMTGLRRETLRISIWAAAVQFACSIAGGYVAGALGVAVGATIGAVVGNVLGLLATRRHLAIWTFISVRRAVLMDAIALVRERIVRRKARD